MRLFKPLAFWSMVEPSHTKNHIDHPLSATPVAASGATLSEWHARHYSDPASAADWRIADNAACIPCVRLALECSLWPPFQLPAVPKSGNQITSRGPCAILRNGDGQGRLPTHAVAHSPYSQGPRVIGKASSPPVQPKKACSNSLTVSRQSRLPSLGGETCTTAQVAYGEPDEQEGSFLHISCILGRGIHIYWHTAEEALPVRNQRISTISDQGWMTLHNFLQYLSNIPGAPVEIAL